MSLSTALLRISPLAPRPPGNQSSGSPHCVGPLSTDGDLRGDIHRCLERESRKWEMNHDNERGSDGRRGDRDIEPGDPRRAEPVPGVPAKNPHEGEDAEDRADGAGGEGE